MVDPPRRGPWHTWFAWHPVKTDWHGWRWLTNIQRRYWRGGGTSGWDYRLPPGDGYCCEAYGEVLSLRTELAALRGGINF